MIIRGIFAGALLCAFQSCVIADEAPPSQSQPAAAPASQTLTPQMHAKTFAAKAAAESGKADAERDPLLSVLDQLSAADWTAEPLKVYVNTGADFGRVQGQSVPIPQTASEALLQEFGCTHALIKQFTRTQRLVQIAVYTFYSPEGAYGAYSCLRSGASTVVVRGTASSEDDNSVSFWQGRRFVVITSKADEDDLSKTLVSKLADTLAKGLALEHSDGTVLHLLSALDRVPGSEKVFLGPLAARRFGSVPNMRDLYVEKSTGAEFAEYQFPPPWSERMRALVIEYGNPAVAENLYTLYSNGLSLDHKIKPVEAGGIICRVNNAFLYSVQHGSRIVVISGARRKESATMLARQVAY